MFSKKKSDRLHCKKCSLTFRRQEPPFDDPTYERVSCSDCNHYLDCWEEDGRVCVSKGPEKTKMVWLDEYIERRPEILGSGS